METKEDRKEEGKEEGGVEVELFSFGFFSAGVRKGCQEPTAPCE